MSSWNDKHAVRLQTCRHANENELQLKLWRWLTWMQISATKRRSIVFFISFVILYYSLLLYCSIAVEQSLAVVSVCLFVWFCLPVRCMCCLLRRDPRHYAPPGTIGLPDCCLSHGAMQTLAKISQKVARFPFLATSSEVFKEAPAEELNWLKQSDIQSDSAAQNSCCVILASFWFISLVDKFAEWPSVRICYYHKISPRLCTRLPGVRSPAVSDLRDCALQVRQHLLSVHGPYVLPSATVPSRQLPHLSGTVCRSQFGHRHHWQFFAGDWRPSFFSVLQLFRLVYQLCIDLRDFFYCYVSWQS